MKSAFSFFYIIVGLFSGFSLVGMDMLIRPNYTAVECVPFEDPAIVTFVKTDHINACSQGDRLSAWHVQLSNVDLEQLLTIASAHKNLLVENSGKVLPLIVQFTRDNGLNGVKVFFAFTAKSLEKICLQKLIGKQAPGCIATFPQAKIANIIVGEPMILQRQWDIKHSFFDYDAQSLLKSVFVALTGTLAQQYLRERCAEYYSLTDKELTLLYYYIVCKTVFLMKQL